MMLLLEYGASFVFLGVHFWAHGHVSFGLEASSSLWYKCVREVLL